jgi:hypothetical protein
MWANAHKPGQSKEMPSIVKKSYTKELMLAVQRDNTHHWVAATIEFEGKTRIERNVRYKSSALTSI